MAKPTTEGQRVRDLEQGTVKDDAGRTLYWARRPFGYDGEDLDRGQVAGFTGARNDEKLIRLGYVLAIIPSNKLLPCRFCKARFIDLNTLNAHGDKRHAKRERGAALPDSPRGVTVDETAGAAQKLEREQQRLDTEAPLNLDKTAASTRG